MEGSGFLPPDETRARADGAAIDAYLAVVAARLRAFRLVVRTAWERGVNTGAAGVIADYLARQHAGLAALASHRHGGVLRWALGSTAEAVLDRRPCPILIVRAGATIHVEPEASPARDARHAS